MWCLGKRSLGRTSVNTNQFVLNIWGTVTLTQDISFSRRNVFKLAWVLAVVKITEDSSLVHISNALHLGHKDKDEGGAELMTLSHSERLGLHSHRHNSSLREHNQGPALFFSVLLLQLNFLLTHGTSSSLICFYLAWNTAEEAEQGASGNSSDGLQLP